jgi:hypothetical protein
MAHGCKPLHPACLIFLDDDDEHITQGAETPTSNALFSSPSPEPKNVTISLPSFYRPRGVHMCRVHDEQVSNNEVGCNRVWGPKRRVLAAVATSCCAVQPGRRGNSRCLLSAECGLSDFPSEIGRHVPTMHSRQETRAPLTGGAAAPGVGLA